jgi:hypothetical protein
MDLMQSFDAILFPADGRPPHVVSLMTSPASFSNPHAPAQTSAARVPHPEVHMEYIAEDPNLRAWHFQVCCPLFSFVAAMPRSTTLRRYDTMFSLIPYHSHTHTHTLAPLGLLAPTAPGN